MYEMNDLTFWLVVWAWSCLLVISVKALYIDMNKKRDEEIRQSCLWLSIDIQMLVDAMYFDCDWIINNPITWRSILKDLEELDAELKSQLSDR